MHIFQYGPAEIDYLTRRDKKLGRAIDHIGMIERQVMPDLFKALVNSVVAQQISRKAADTVWGRLCGRLLDVTPRNVASTDVSDIQKCGLSMRKAGYIKGISEAAIRGDLDILELKDETEFLTVNLFESLDAVKAFAGPDYEVPVFEPEARRLLSKVEPIARHYDVRKTPQY